MTSPDPLANPSDGHYLLYVVDGLNKRIGLRWPQIPQTTQPLVAQIKADSNTARLVGLLTIAIVPLLVALLHSNPDANALLEHSGPTAVLGCTFTGSLLVFFYIVLQYIFFVNPTSEASISSSMLRHAKDFSVNQFNPWRTIRFLRQSHRVLAILVVGGLSRILALIFLSKFRQCAVPSLEAFLPCIYVLGIIIQSDLRHGGNADHELSIPEEKQRLLAKFQPNSLRKLGVASLLTLANLVTAWVGASPRSTYICETLTIVPTATFALQCFSVLLDSSILWSIQSLLEQLDRSGGNGLQAAPFLFGLILLVLAPLLLAGGLFVHVIPSIEFFREGLDATYFGNLAWMVLLCIIFILFFIRFTINASLMTFLFTVSGVLIISNLWGALANQFMFSYSVGFMAIVATSSYVAGFSLHLDSAGPILTSFVSSSRRRLKILLYTFGFVVICLAILERFPGLTGYNVFNGHPIDDLIIAAHSKHKTWAEQARTSADFHGAVAEYRRRYNRVPPPGFDYWYKFATDRDSVVIDDFDTIENDLAPFWALTPQEIRLRTKQAVFGGHNDVVEIRIRNRGAYVPDMIPTHRWMLEGIVRMLDPFIKHLPDMDLAFNINDEPRVTVPFDDLQKLRQVPTQMLEGFKSGRWSEGRSQQFDMFANETAEEKFESLSFRPNFQKFGTIACPANSPARKIRSWDFSRLCTWCFKPHSIGHFVRDWKLSASPCHQPDLANLHGFYASAAAFKATKTLFPIFSQSKAHGFSDILYPTAWNYIDKISYAPSPEKPDHPFVDKATTLFWRGSTTEGFSGFGSWRGMVRQRLAFLNNNSTASWPVFLPLSSSNRHRVQPQQRFTYSSLTRPSFISHPSITHANLSLDTHLTEVTRCGYGDCERETAQFQPTDGVDFQEHWRYKYLMDMDGAGFSGRFLPFLQSRSLPLKTALFREWYDDRIEAWAHFVPVDLRLNGLWSVVAYFAGNFGRGKGIERVNVGDNVRGLMEPGEWIAEEGRHWAGKALRKEDMEIYFFRLLLEWGRLTDDRRDALGYTMDGLGS